MLPRAPTLTLPRFAGEGIKLPLLGQQGREGARGEAVGRVGAIRYPNAARKLASSGRTV